MSFNPDPSKQAQEVIFSRKLNKDYHPPLAFNNNNVPETDFYLFIYLFYFSIRAFFHGH